MLIFFYLKNNRNNINKMNNDTTIQRIIKEYSLSDVQQLLIQSDNYYYNNIYPEPPSSSSIKQFIELTDDQYDKLREYYNSKSSKPYLNIGAEINNNKIQLPIHMGSMDKIKKDSTELRSFLKNFTHVKCISEKLDGISLLLDLTSKSVKAYTRGDGSVGQSVSHIIQHVKNLKKPLKEFRNGNRDYSGFIRGELIISKGNWAKISNKGKNARNYVSGIVNKKECNPSDFDYVDFIAYQYIPYPISSQIITPSVQMTFLEQSGYTVPRYELFAHPLIKSDWLMNTLLDWKDKSKYEIDGLIVTDNHIHKFTVAGNPDYAKAFKFNSLEESVETIVTTVEWNISKDGKLKPTVLVEPVDIEGVTIQRVTAFNARFIVDNNIGEGAIIRIIRSGGVIPYIVGVTDGVKPELPDMEKENLIWDSNNVDIIMKTSNNNFAMSDNSDTDDEKNDRKTSETLTMSEKMDVKQIEHFIQTMGIEYYKAKTIEKGYKQANIKNMYDLLKATTETFEKIDGIKNKSSTKIVESIKKQINIMPIHVFAAGLSIFPNMGVKKLELIFNKKDIIENLVNSLTITNMSLQIRMNDNIINSILRIGGFSITTAKVFVENFINFYELWDYLKINYPNSKIALYPENVYDLTELDDNLLGEEENETKLKDLQGLRIVFTGFRNASLEKLIQKYNGYVADTLIKCAKGILIVKDKDKVSSKAVKAQTLNYPIMTEEEFMNEYSI
jgi:DNA ligase (NAD+)